MIAWYDNVPVLSYCSAARPVPPLRRADFVALSGGGTDHRRAVLLFRLRAGARRRPPSRCACSARCWWGLLFSDLEERILPDELTKGGMALGFIFALFVPVPGTLAQSLLVARGGRRQRNRGFGRRSGLRRGDSVVLPMGAGAIYEKIRHKEGLGFGDVKLIAMMGTFLGLQGARRGLVPWIGERVDYWIRIYQGDEAGSGQL